MTRILTWYCWWLVTSQFTIYLPYPSIPTGFRLGEVDALPNCLGHWHPKPSTWSTLILAEMNYGAKPFKWLKISAPKETHNRFLSIFGISKHQSLQKKLILSSTHLFETNFPKTSRFVVIFRLWPLGGFGGLLQPLGLDWGGRR